MASSIIEPADPTQQQRAVEPSYCDACFYCKIITGLLTVAAGVDLGGDRTLRRRPSTPSKQSLARRSVAAVWCGAQYVPLLYQIQFSLSKPPVLRCTKPTYNHHGKIMKYCGTIIRDYEYYIIHCCMQYIVDIMISCHTNLHKVQTTTIIYCCSDLPNKMSWYTYQVLLFTQYNIPYTKPSVCVYVCERTGWFWLINNAAPILFTSLKKHQTLPHSCY